MTDRLLFDENGTRIEVTSMTWPMIVLLTPINGEPLPVRFPEDVAAHLAACLDGGTVYSELEIETLKDNARDEGFNSGTYKGQNDAAERLHAILNANRKGVDGLADLFAELRALQRALQSVGTS